MVWSQYVYEATDGFDTDVSVDDEEYQPEFHLNIHDWSVEYSDELWYLWDMINLYIHDAFLENVIFTECDFTEFVDFCYACDKYSVDTCIDYPYTGQLSYIWSKIQEYLQSVHLTHEILVGATFNDFVAFVMTYSEQKNIVL